MHFEQFEIFNFKGIRHAIVPLNPRGAGIYTLIGLNESGKTTLLEAINSFEQAKTGIPALYAGEVEGGDKNEWGDDPTTFVPKRDKSNFSDQIYIAATICFETGEKEKVIADTEKEHKCRLDRSTIPDRFIITRGYVFEDSDVKKYINTWNIVPKVKRKGGRNFKLLLSPDPIWSTFANKARALIPEILYFPTFLFNQPEKIILTPHEDETEINALYRGIIENVAASLPKPLDVQRHIVDRIVNEETFRDRVLNLMLLAPDKQHQVEAAKSEISAHLTETVFERWSRTFGGDFSGREIVLLVNVDNAEPDAPLVYAQFAIKEKTATYQITERSLGFRWFFSFILFTLYQVAGKKSVPTLFLLDEPASNLHSRAQMQLLDSLPKIAKARHQIVYSTHSHYLVNPDWLDQACIVSNAAIDYNDPSDSKARLGQHHTDVTVQRYRSFVGAHPDKTTYFQPVLDKLDVAPSRLDLVRPSVLVEGKGDYRIIEYVRRVKLKVNESFAVVPTRGAAGMAELLGLFLGWGVPFGICLDDDAAGRAAAKTYLDDWGLSENLVRTLAAFDPKLKGKAVEGLLEVEDLQLVSNHFALGGPPTKKQVQLFFGEMLAREIQIACSDELIRRVERIQSYFAGLLDTSALTSEPIKQ